MPSLGLGASLDRGGAVPEVVSPYTTFKTWENDANLISATLGFRPNSWSTTQPSLSFETAALDGETDYAKLVVNATQTGQCQWRAPSSALVPDGGSTFINFADYTKWRVQAKLYCILDSSRTQITFTTSFGTTEQDKFQTTLQDQTWTTIDVSGETIGMFSSFFYLYEWDRFFNFPIAGESYYMKDVKLSLG